MNARAMNTDSSDTTPTDARPMTSTPLSSLRAEALKLRRCSVWVVAAVVPLMAVITGATNTAMNLDQFTGGWDSLWGQVTLFYGLAFFSVGIAAVASAGWRMEHRGGWHLLGAGPASFHGIVAAKLVVLAGVVVAMQALLVALTWLAGIIVLGLPPALPGVMVTGTLVSTITGLAVLSLQSLLSMLIRSFAAPIALSLFASIAGIGIVFTQPTLSFLVPQALVLRAHSLTSSAFSEAQLTLGSAAEVAIPALILTVLFAVVAGWVLEHRDVRA